MSISAQCLSVSPATTPEVLPLANDSLPGLALAYAISSLTDFAGMLGMDDQHQRVASHPRDRREVLDRIVGDVLHQEGHGRMRAVGAHEQRVAVRRRARDVQRRKRAVRARTVLDHDGLLERDAEMLADDAGDRVGGAAGTERDDDGDRLARISRSGALRVRCRTAIAPRRRRSECEAESSCAVPPCHRQRRPPVRFVSGRSARLPALTLT